MRENLEKHWKWDTTKNYRHTPLSCMKWNDTLGPKIYQNIFSLKGSVWSKTRLCISSKTQYLQTSSWISTKIFPIRNLSSLQMKWTMQSRSDCMNTFARNTIESLNRWRPVLHLIDHLIALPTNLKSVAQRSCRISCQRRAATAAECDIHQFDRHYF